MLAVYLKLLPFLSWRIGLSAGLLIAVVGVEVELEVEVEAPGHLIASLIRLMVLMSAIDAPASCHPSRKWPPLQTGHEWGVNPKRCLHLQRKRAITGLTHKNLTVKKTRWIA
jgi:hypothetical protein